MADGMIPINLDDLPIDTVAMDDSQVYTGEFTKSTMSPKLDKSGNMFCAIQVAVTEGDFEGRTVMRQWLPMPVAISADMTKRERILAQDRSVTFTRFCRAFGIKGKMPSVALDADSVSTWQDWISQFYGNLGKFTVQNQEFPEGSGRVRSGINDFVF
jgi:hypothetical protein